MSRARSAGEEARELTATETQTLQGPLWWGIAVGILQALSPLAFWWLSPSLVWALGLVVIASIYVGFAVADGRRHVIVTEIAVASAFIILAAVAITSSTWLVVVGLVGHGLKDLWQHRTHFVANTRWWPPFCLVVDAAAAIVIAVFLVTGIDLDG
jgi:hypothetical protein